MRARRPSRGTGKTINALPDDVLLDIFHYHWSTVDAHWSQRWCTLAHVCRRWNQLILASSHHLGLHLRFSFGAQAEDMMAYSPPFPLVLDYHTRYGQMWKFSDIDGVLFALQHLHRAHEIVLSAPASTLSKLTGAMAGPAPILERLELESQTTDFVLPRRILDINAPRLQVLKLSGVVLPALYPLLLSPASSLVNLTLHRIPSSASFSSPDSLASCIRSMSQLQTLSLSFLSAAPRSAGDRVPSPIQTPCDSERAELPMLEELAYRGPPTYLDALLAKFRAAPRMRKIHLTLFNQLTFSIPHVASFIHAGTVYYESPTLALVDFYESAACLTAIPTRPTALQRLRSSSRPHSSSSEMEISIRVPCERLDYQLSALAAICGALARTLCPIAELMIGFYARELPPQYSAPPYHDDHDHDDAIDVALWLALLAPFRGARTLRVDAALGAEISRALVSSVSAEEGAGEGEGEWGGGREERPILLPALRAVGPLYQVNLELDASVSVSEACAMLHQLAERNRRRLAERSVVVEVP